MVDQQDPAPNDPISAKMTALGDSVAGLQSVLGTTTQDLLTTLSSNLSMMQSMNTMMDQYVQQALSIRTWITSLNRLRLRIENRSGIALNACQTSVAVMPTGAAADRHPIRFALSGPDSSRFCEDENDHSWKVEEATDLGPGDFLQMELEIGNLPKFSRYNAAVRLLFPSPGSGAELQREHVLGIGLLHQCELRYEMGAEPPADDSRNTYQFNAKAIRHLWKVPDTLGIATRSLFYAKAPTGDELQLYVVELAGEHGSDVKIVCSSPESFPADLIEEEILRMRYSDDLGV